MLCVSELAEAMEGHRKGLMDDKLPHRKMAEVELVDFLIRAFDMAGGLRWDINSAGKEGLPDLNEYGKHYAYMLSKDIPDNFAESLLRIVKFIGDCHDYPVSFLRRAIVWTLGIMSKNGMEIEATFQEKMAYNAHREDHKLEHRAQPGGKAY